MAILLTGGAGYIGSHTLVELLERNYEIVVLDNLVNSSEQSLEAVKKITKTTFHFYRGDVRDSTILDTIFSQHSIDAVMHFAGLKAVGESVRKPLEYYDNNVTGTICLLEAMKKAQVKSIIFSSSASVYGTPERMPITEDMPTGNTTNPYGTSKYMVERVLIDATKADPKLSAVILRYFNPIGAHESGLIGEDPMGIPNNLMPYISQVAVGKLEQLSIFGNDYPTVDGTGVRDYIHVVDLARGHIKALERHQHDSGSVIYNLGTGRGYSVLEMVNAFEKCNNVAVPYRFAPRREGDVPINFACPDKAFNELGFKTEFDLERMVVDTWRWQKNNPNGFNS